MGAPTIVGKIRCDKVLVAKCQECEVKIVQNNEILQEIFVDLPTLSH